MQTVRIQIRPLKQLGHIWEFLKEFFENINFEKNQQTIKEGPRALDRSSESRHIRWCIGLWLKRYHLQIFLFLTELNILINFGGTFH